MAMAKELTVGGWTFGKPPAGWEAVPGAGLRLNQKGQFQSNVVVAPDELGEDETLEAYIVRQRAALESVLADVKFDGPVRKTLPGAEEVLELVLQFTLHDTAIVQRQLYTRRARQVSVITLTTNAAGALIRDPNIRDDTSLRASAGLSVFWDSPLGPIRFDFSQVLAKEDYDNTETFRFSTNTRFR